MLGIVGSPRRGGNTESLVDEVLTGAQEAGALTEKVILNKLDIRSIQLSRRGFVTTTSKGRLTR